METRGDKILGFQEKVQLAPQLTPIYMPRITLFHSWDPC